MTGHNKSAFCFLPPSFDIHRFQIILNSV
jgi:hypothetical protein